MSVSYTHLDVYKRQVQWCKNKITDSNALIIKKGKNYYVFIDNYKITVNGSSYTIITAHKENNC